MHAATYSELRPAARWAWQDHRDRMEKEEGLPGRAAVMGQRLQDRLQTLRSLPVVGDVRGLGAQAR